MRFQTNMVKYYSTPIKVTIKFSVFLHFWKPF